MNIRPISPEDLRIYSKIPISFLVNSFYEVEPLENGLGGILLNEMKNEDPFTKDYDATGKAPTSWPDDFDVSNWGFFMAFQGEKPVGGATLAYDTAGVNMLAGRDDLTVLWDIRVHPDHRGEGVGTELFDACREWSRKKGCKWMKVETQNINVTACKFYVKMGCILGEIDVQAYVKDGVTHETMLIWYLKL